MGLFGKKKEVRNDSVPSMPELPQLPDFPQLDIETSNINTGREIHKLPSFPSNSFGTKFSQNTIKEAVAGEKEVDDFPGDEDFSFGEEVEDEMEINQEPYRRSMMQPTGKLRGPSLGEEFEESSKLRGFRKTMEFDDVSPPKKRFERERRTYEKEEDTEEERGTSEPIFIRIDKFEETLRIFNETKKKINEIERDLEDIRKVREKEEEELQTWENEVRFMKEQIEKVDKDVFSKV